MARESQLKWTEEYEYGGCKDGVTFNRWDCKAWEDESQDFSLYVEEQETRIWIGLGINSRLVSYTQGLFCYGYSSKTAIKV